MAGNPVASLPTTDAIRPDTIDGGRGAAGLEKMVGSKYCSSELRLRNKILGGFRVGFPKVGRVRTRATRAVVDWWCLWMGAMGPINALAWSTGHIIAFVK